MLMPKTVQERWICIHIIEKAYKNTYSDLCSASIKNNYKGKNLKTNEAC